MASDEPRRAKEPNVWLLAFTTRLSNKEADLGVAKFIPPLRCTIDVPNPKI